MEITTREADSVSVVRIAGNLDTNTAPEAQQRLDDLQDAGAEKILVNFEASPRSTTRHVTSHRAGPVGNCKLTRSRFGLMSPKSNIRLSLGALTILAVAALFAITLAGASFAVILTLILILMVVGMLLLERTGRQEMAGRTQQTSASVHGSRSS